MSRTSWEDTCSLCNRSRFWPSKSRYFVCAICHPDPLQALAILARRGRPGVIRRAQRWAQVTTDGETLRP
jgi:hypothetical protein